MRIAANKPGFCSVCYGAHPDRRYVDCEADYDGAPVLDRETRTIAILPWNGELAAHDNIAICENCVRQMAELIAFKPELHQRQLREIRKLEIQVEHWRDTAKRFKAEADRQIAANLGEDTIPAPRRRVRAA